MNPNVWKLHASVFELARARGLGAFRLDYKAHPGGVMIGLVIEAANDVYRRDDSLMPSKPASH